MRADPFRRMALSLALLLGMAAVGLSSAGLSASASTVARGSAAVVPINLGFDAANVPVKLDGADERGAHGRATKPNSPMDAAALVSLVAIVVALAWWATRRTRRAGRPQALPWQSPQRAPPSFTLASA